MVQVDERRNILIKNATKFMAFYIIIPFSPGKTMVKGGLLSTQ